MSATTQQQREFFSKNGYLRYGRVYSEDKVEELREALAEVRSGKTEKVAIGARAEGQVVVELDFSKTEGRATPSLTRMFRVHDVFRRHVLNPTIASIAAEVLGADRLRLMEDQVIIKEPGKSTPLNWHQDYVYWPFDRPEQVSCWLALDYVTEETGGMQFVPGSHRLGEFARVDFESGEPVEADQDKPRLPSDPTAEHDVVAVDLEPGECVFHHSLTWHATKANTGNNLRRGLITRFMKDGVIFRPDKSPGHPISNLDGLAPGEPIAREDEFPLVYGNGQTL